MAATAMHTEDVTLFNDPLYNTAEDKISWVEYNTDQHSLVNEVTLSFIST